ncbi:ATP-dependent RNA helicase dbp5 [Reticulomyxa filosa]|uniref:ATP-dependent RNA helicase n=1 Tax=Reticulomyxa filosa TaxID=46433 RepID=X6NP85_RETFI|nr:ATP-dependent RNA helicase dbp5 [Reticulomyxa filosa]|eukprot:ETO27831.1 ATP-dependent RNA helicase dbp5 [Reticulomyxa filosa]
MFSPYNHDEITSFDQLNLRKELIEACALAHFVRPSKIQANALPILLSKSKYPNFVGQAQHGSGKTATFALTILQRIEEESTKLQAICLCHSRELAIQTHDVIKNLSCRMNNVEIFLAVKDETLPAPWKHQIIVGTPGTLLKLLFNTKTDVSLSEFLKKLKMYYFFFLIECRV